MRKALQLEGVRSGRLLAVERVENNKKGDSRWLCLCDCGEKVVTLGYRIKSGYTRSCGCLQREVIGKSATIHGMYGTRLHKCWQGMKERCDNPNEKSYSDYGGRGIKYCDEWKDFKPFYEWAINNGYSDKLTIDRIDVNGNYEPSNCRWSTDKEQSNNRRSSKFITVDGVTKTLAQWSDITGIKSATLNYRYNSGIRGKELIDPIDRRRSLK